MSKKRIGRIDVAYELLAEVLAFPPGSKIVQVWPSDMAFVFTVVVEHPDLPEVEDGGFIPVVDYTVTRTEGRFHVVAGAV